ncbi:substrate-binding domain-containing protein [Herbiconiux ginsengi]|uniref:substrate-binding domain-containing protein n=1 Tax=Herbiconiux ginsengi TaxID=381665 RepID=UPI000B87E390
MTAMTAGRPRKRNTSIELADDCSISVPSQLAVIGHDNSPFSTLIAPALTTIDIDASGLGRHLANRALAVVRGEPELPAVPPRGASKRDSFVERPPDQSQ